ncbi:MAG TPA: GNAT family protein [Thermoplasmata archaeon]|nr:GNAT family protein [Thermoplasmata archaeon]
MLAHRMVGNRVELRPLTAADAPALDRILHDRQVTRALPYRVRHETGREWTTRVLLEQRQGDGVAFAIRPIGEREVAGQIRLMNWTRGEREAEVGYWIRRKSWGRGYGTESLRLICRFGFASMELHRLVANVVAGNERSLAALERVGFRREGVRREGTALADGWADVVVLGLLRGELRALPRRV